MNPWGCAFDNKERRNNSESDTTPVGQIPRQATAHGCADMSGNVWEWMSSLYQAYPYRADDGREDSEAAGSHVQRGGAELVIRPWRGSPPSTRPTPSATSTPGFRCGVVSRPFSSPPADH